jgi:hypothetical protein
MAKVVRRGPHVQKGTPAPPTAPLAAEPGAAPSDAGDPAPPAAEAARGGWGWGLALFLWATAFGFLLLYELLASVIKAAGRLF